VDQSGPVAIYADLLKCSWRGVADDEIAKDTAAQSSDFGQDEDPDGIETLLHGGQSAGDRGHEGARQLKDAQRGMSWHAQLFSRDPAR
jgi:hypothetical protein